MTPKTAKEILIETCFTDKPANGNEAQWHATKEDIIKAMELYRSQSDLAKEEEIKQLKNDIHERDEFITRKNIEMSNYAYQTDSAKRDRDKAESKYESLKEENERLTQWKKEALIEFKKWDNVLDFAQNSGAFELGSNIPTEVLKKLKSITFKPEQTEEPKPYSINHHREGDGIIRIYNSDGHIYCMYPYYRTIEAREHLKQLNELKVGEVEQLSKWDSRNFPLSPGTTKILNVENQPEESKEENDIAYEPIKNLAYRCLQWSEGEISGYDMKMLENLLPIVMKPLWSKKSSFNEVTELIKDEYRK